ncbi:hypothetical protein GCM10018954_079040 [Kutzneria kofuensis]
MQAALDAGPAAYGRTEDQRWTLARIALPIGRLFSAPELNPVEGAWSHLKRGLGNLATRGVDQLAA